MAKTFKRIAALATVIALVVCFAVSASAINVATTTQYAGENVNVTVNVTGAGDAAYVTYYAKNRTGDVVYVDQEALNGGSATIKYQTAESSLKGAVKVGYAGASSAETKDITANTITYPGGTKYLPTEAKDANITINYTPSAVGKTFGTVAADKNATVGEIKYNSTAGTIEVPLSAISGDVTLTVTEIDDESVTVVPTFIDAAALVVKEGAEDEVVNKAEVGARKMTVIGMAKNATDSTDYGIIVSKSAITGIVYDNLEAFDSYKALDNRDDGLFAVQIIDEATDELETTIKAGASYYVGIYVEAGGKFYVNASATPVVVPAQ